MYCWLKFNRCFEFDFVIAVLCHFQNCPTSHIASIKSQVVKNQHRLNKYIHFDFERTWWSLFQKRVVRTKLYIYVFITITGRYLCRWTFIPEGLIHPVTSVSTQTYFIKYIHYWKYYYFLSSLRDRWHLPTLTILLSTLVSLLSKSFKLFAFSYLLSLSTPDEDYSRNAVSTNLDMYALLKY